jgi:hypothetical protein
MGENLEVVRAEFSTVSLAVLLITPKIQSRQAATSKVENSGPGFVLLAEVYPWSSLPRLQMPRLFLVRNCSSRFWFVKIIVTNLKFYSQSLG